MFEALLILFAFGGFWFWGLLGVVSLLIILSLEHEREGTACILTLGTLAAILFFGNTGWLTWLIENPWSTVGYIAGYLGVGVVYGVGKWWVYVRDVAIRHRARRREWLASECDKLRDRTATGDDLEHARYQQALKTGVIPDDIKAEWKKAREGWYGRRIAKPMVSENKSRITGWMTWWPWSGLWTLINDPIRRFFNWAYDQLGGVLQAISDRAFKDIDID
jgi:hypothetical protein